MAHCFASFLGIGSADPRISAFILCAAVLEAKPCCGLYALCTHCVALCSAALHEPQKNGSKTRYSGDKTELRKERVETTARLGFQDCCAQNKSGYSRIRATDT